MRFCMCEWSAVIGTQNDQKERCFSLQNSRLASQPQNQYTAVPQQYISSAAVHQQRSGTTAVVLQALAFVPVVTVCVSG